MLTVVARPSIGVEGRKSHGAIQTSEITKFVESQSLRGLFLLSAANSTLEQPNLTNASEWTILSLWNPNLEIPGRLGDREAKSSKRVRFPLAGPAFEGLTREILLPPMMVSRKQPDVTRQRNDWAISTSWCKLELLCCVACC